MTLSQKSYGSLDSMRDNILGRKHRLFLIGTAVVVLALVGFSMGLLINASTSVLPVAAAASTAP